VAYGVFYEDSGGLSVGNLTVNLVDALSRAALAGLNLAF